MTQTLGKIFHIAKSKRREREKIRLKWNEKFPPDTEVHLSPSLSGQPTTYGIWKLNDGVMIILKDKNGYHPNKRLYITTEVINAIKEMSA